MPVLVGGWTVAGAVLGRLLPLEGFRVLTLVSLGLTMPGPAAVHLAGWPLSATGPKPARRLSDPGTGRHGPQARAASERPRNGAPRAPSPRGV